MSEHPWEASLPGEGGPLYGPHTISWRVFRQWVFLLGGMRAVLMQLAHPKVAAGVAHHSNFAADSFERLHRTMEAMWAVGVGEPGEGLRTLEGMEAVHARVRGTLPDGRPYDARDSHLKLWVHATLIDTVLVFERRYLGELTEDDRRRYYLETLLLAEAFGIGRSLVPADLDSFRAYVDRQVSTLEVTGQARRLARDVLHPRVRHVPDLAYEPLRLVTADLLPERFRRAYGLPWGSHHRQAARLIRAASRGVVPRLPGPLRTLPLLEVAAAVHRRLAA